MSHYCRFQPLFLCLVVAFCFLVPAESHAQSEFTPEGYFYWSDAELLRTAEQRLYLWLSPDQPANSDFTIELYADSDLLLRCRIDKIASRVVVSELIPDSLIASVASANHVETFVYLNTTAYSDRPLVVGTPSSFVPIVDAVGDLLDEPLQNAETNSGYSKLADAQVELALGGLDLLLLPESEVDDGFRCTYQVYPTDWRVEWYLATDLPDYDLLPAALSYGLKGVLADTALQLSSIVSPDDAARYFPASANDAQALFEQMPTTQAQRSIGCGVAADYPATVSSLKRRLSNCGGAVSVVGYDAELPLRLLPLVTCGDLQLSSDLALGQLYQQLSASGFSWAAQLDDEQANLVELSRKLSRELKLIPLGSQQLVLAARPEVHQIDGRFYLVEPK